MLLGALAEPEKATEKSIELMKMSVARSRLLSPLTGTSFAVNQTGLVIGGGVSGMTAALALANQGFKVHLVERSDKLGGNALDLSYTLEHEDVKDFVSNLAGQVERHENIALHLETGVSGVAGFIGSFEVMLSREGVDKEVKCGAIIVATGAGPAATREYLYGKSDRVLTQVELEKKLAKRALPLNGTHYSHDTVRGLTQR